MAVVEFNIVIEKKIHRLFNVSVASHITRNFFEDCKVEESTLTVETYLENIRGVWNKKTSVLRDLYDENRILGYDGGESFEYFVFGMENNEFVNKRKNTLHIIAFANCDSIIALLKAVMKSIKSKFYWVDISLLSRCRIYTWNEKEKDILDSHIYIETDISKEVPFSLADYLKLAFLISVFVVLGFWSWHEWANAQPVIAASKADSNINIDMVLILKLPFIVSLFAGASFSLIFEIICFIAKWLNRGIYIDNVQRVLESFDRSMSKNNFSRVVEGLEQEQIQDE